MKTASQKHNHLKVESEKTKCVICCQVLGTKKQLLHGMKCMRFDIREKLKSFLHPLDFVALYNESVFPEPRICNLCFITIKQIPKGINKLQDLLGVPINLKLYKPHRQDWDVNIDSLVHLEKTHKSSEVSTSEAHSCPDTSNNGKKLTAKQTKAGRKVRQSLSRTTNETTSTCKNSSNNFERRSYLQGHSKSLQSPLTSLAKSKNTESSGKTSCEPENEQKKDTFIPQHLKEDILLGDNKMTVLCKESIKHGKSDNGQGSTLSRLAAGASPVMSAHSQRMDTTQLLEDNEYSIKSTLATNLNILSAAEHNNGRQRRITRSIVNLQPLQMTRSLTRSKSTKRQIKDINTRSNKTLQSKQNARYKMPINYRERDISEVDKTIVKTAHSKSKVGHEPVALSKNSLEFKVTRNQNSDSIKSNCKSNVKCALKVQNEKCKKLTKQEEMEEVAKSTIHRTDIPTSLSKHSKKKLQGLANKMHKSHDSDLTHVCGYPDCGKGFRQRSSLQVHYRTHTGERPHTFAKPGHYKCTSEGCNRTFMRKEKYELHLCTHTPEHVLYCEKCGKQFGCQRYLDVHYKVHEKNVKNALHPPERTVLCEVSGCSKTFTCHVYMKRHIISYHMGKRPRPVSGVFFTCAIEGCGKKFTLKSTLCRHNLLVHRGGDYKLNRTVVRYPCTYSDCGTVFNRKNLLEKHMVNEHGKVPKQLLSQQTREHGCIEKMCSHCGLVLTSALLVHHENIYHCTNDTQDTKESAPYLCHLEGCDMKFKNQAERRSHVQSHIENPPYKCEVEECKETFFLLKNLDNHLWDHSKKTSTCDVDGCSQTFDDQLQLAKHSKVHYDGKMKCPWRNCGSWFTAMGTLKQHFLAHSRSLTASFGWDFVCNKCDRVFSSKYGLKNHKKTHEEKMPEKLVTLEFICEEPGCKTEFSQHKQFFDHFLHHFTNIPTACKFGGCTETLSTMLLQSKHGKSHYGGKYMCPWQDCDKMFASSFFQVKKHVYRHLLSILTIATDRPYSCSQCDMVFRVQSNLLNHMAQHSEKSDYVCTVCGKRFHHNHLKRHMLTHRQEKAHVCPHCGVRYGTVNGLKFHILQKHKIGKWPFKCSYCSKGFISSTEMRRHLPSHTKEKPFSCELCGDTFATHTGYKGHMRKHAGQKYVCDVEGCGKVYTTALSMRGHKAQHAGFSKMCPFCGKTYKNPYGHKCKASRDAKQNGCKQGSFKVCPTEMPSTTSAVSVQTPVSVTTPMQHTVIISPTVGIRGAAVEQTNRITMVHNPTQLAHFIPSNVTHGLAQGLPQIMPQSLTHVLPSNSMIQDSGHQPFSLDITKGTHMNIPGDYTFNNYVVFWDSQNVT